MFIVLQVGYIYPQSSVESVLVSLTHPTSFLAKFSEEYWTLINSVREVGVTVETDDDEPAFARIPDGSDVVGPQQSRD